MTTVEWIGRLWSRPVTSPTRRTLPERLLHQRLITPAQYQHMRYLAIRDQRAIASVVASVSQR